MTKLETLKCVEVTSQTQANNGTQCFHDPITGCDYLSYDSGYIRRAYTAKNWRTGKPHRTIYQLNPTRKRTEVSQWNGREYEVTERVMVTDPAERLDRLARAVANYRVTMQKEAERIAAYKASQKAKEQIDTRQLQNDIYMTTVQDSIYQYFQGNLSFEMAVHEIKEALEGISVR